MDSRPRPAQPVAAAEAAEDNLWSRFWRDVWRDPHNAALRRLRGRPELIRPGDHVWVP